MPPGQHAPSPSPLATSSPLVHGAPGSRDQGPLAARANTRGDHDAHPRLAGIMLHVTSLPGPDGIGDLGAASRAWIEWMSAAGQRVWQVLPLHPPAGASGSPYDAASAFAINPLLISLDDLVADGLVPDNMPALRTSVGARHAGVDPLEQVARWKLPLLRQAARALMGRPNTDPLRREYIEFCQREAWWLTDYVAFTALRELNPGVGRSHWRLADRVRRLAASRASTLEIGATHQHPEAALQFLADRQLLAMAQHARMHDVSLIGDLPLYVSDDSADVWAHPELFLLDHEARPRVQTGAPPDEFDPRGQVWGMPAYDWKANADGDWEWWLRRIRHLTRWADVLRIDHARAFADWWSIPLGATYGTSGHWEPGPGASFFAAVKRALGEVQFIAEDLGMRTDALRQFQMATGLPSMRVLVQGFDEGEGSEHLAAAWTGNEAAYTSTHDFNTVRGWADESQLGGNGDLRVSFAMRTIGARTNEELVAASIQCVLDSPARWAIIPLQDWLGLDGDSRMNVPGTASGNWRWCASASQLDADLASRMLRAVEHAGRT